MKRMFMIIILLIPLILIGNIAQAAQSDDFVINVNITGTTKELTIVETSTDTYSALDADVTYSSITVTNSSTGIIADYQIKASTTSGWDLSADETAGPDEAVLWALVKAGDSASGTFGADDLVSFNYQDCSDTTFGDAATCNIFGTIKGAGLKISSRKCTHGIDHTYESCGTIHLHPDHTWIFFLVISYLLYDFIKSPFIRHRKG